MVALRDAEMKYQEAVVYIEKLSREQIIMDTNKRTMSDELEYLKQELANKESSSFPEETRKANCKKRTCDRVHHKSNEECK